MLPPRGSGSRELTRRGERPALGGGGGAMSVLAAEDVVDEVTEETAADNVEVGCLFDLTGD